MLLVFVLCGLVFPGVAAIDPRRLWRMRLTSHPGIIMMLEALGGRKSRLILGYLSRERALCYLSS